MVWIESDQVDESTSTEFSSSDEKKGQEGSLYKNYEAPMKPSMVRSIGVAEGRIFPHEKK